jgi:hypothetical protein
MTLMNNSKSVGSYKLTALEQKLTKIANKHIPELADRKSLKAYYSDHTDFFETSVWSLEEALKAAYELGKNERK